MRTFVFTDDKSNKFWNIDLQGTAFTVTFGKVGTKGQTQAKDFPDAAAARKAHDKLVAEKLGKGYVETTAAAAPARLAAAAGAGGGAGREPRRPGSHSAYADYLMEQGDPRGEFIQVQLALEDPSRPAAERSDAPKREPTNCWRSTPGSGSATWAGSWSATGAARTSPSTTSSAAAGPTWSACCRPPTPPRRPGAVAGGPPAAPAGGGVRHALPPVRLRPVPGGAERGADGRGGADDSEIYEEATILPPLLESPYLTNLRVFKLGFSDAPDQIAHSTMVSPFEDCTAEQVIELLGKCPAWRTVPEHDLPGIDRSSLAHARQPPRPPILLRQRLLAGPPRRRYPLSALAETPPWAAHDPAPAPRPGRDASTSTNWTPSSARRTCRPDPLAGPHDRRSATRRAGASSSPASCAG